MGHWCRAQPSVISIIWKILYVIGIYVKELEFLIVFVIFFSFGFHPALFWLNEIVIVLIGAYELLNNTSSLWNLGGIQLNSTLEGAEERSQDTVERCPLPGSVTLISHEVLPGALSNALFELMEEYSSVWII